MSLNPVRKPVFFLSVSRTYDAMSISSLSRVVMFKQVFTLHACDSFCVCSFHRTVFYRYIQVKLRETEKQMNLTIAQNHKTRQKVFHFDCISYYFKFFCLFVCLFCCGCCCCCYLDVLQFFLVKYWTKVVQSACNRGLRRFNKDYPCRNLFHFRQ